MNQTNFEQFILQYGKDILRFCRVVTMNQEAGDELYQDTMVRMLEKSRKLTPDGNAKNYALSVAMLLWKNQKKRRQYSVRRRKICRRKFRKRRSYYGRSGEWSLLLQL